MHSPEKRSLHCYAELRQGTELDLVLRVSGNFSGHLTQSFKDLSALSVSVLRQKENRLQRQSAFLRHIQNGANENSNSDWKSGVVVSA